MRSRKLNNLAEPSSYLPRSVLTTLTTRTYTGMRGLGFKYEQFEDSNALLNKMMLWLKMGICQEWIRSSAKAIMFMHIKYKGSNMGLTPIKAIRAHCLKCGGGQPKEVRDCLIPECPIFPFRMGKNPNRKGIGGIKPNSAEKTELS